MEFWKIAINLRFSSKRFNWIVYIITFWLSISCWTTEVDPYFRSVAWIAGNPLGFAAVSPLDGWKNIIFREGLFFVCVFFLSGFFVFFCKHMFLSQKIRSNLTSHFSGVGFWGDNSKCPLSLVPRSVMLHDLWFTDISRSDHFQDYQNIHKIPQKIMLMNVGNPEALETLKRNPLSCFPPIRRPHVIHFWETKLLPPRVAKTNIDRRGSSDAECCEEIFCRAEICFFNCKKKRFVFPLFWTDQQGIFLN